MMHDAYVEMCGMFSNEDLTRPEFDAFLRKGLTAAVGMRDNFWTRPSEIRQGQPLRQASTTSSANVWCYYN